MFEKGSIVAVAGSRSLSADQAGQVSEAASSLLESGHRVAVGCCVGADEAVIRAALANAGASSLNVMCAFGPGGVGACPVSAVSAAETARAAGARVSWWAGGGASVPLRARLARRTHAVAASAPGGLFVCFGSPESAGSLLACRAAISAGRPVLALPLGFGASALPLPGVGEWQAAGISACPAAVRWVPLQASIL